MSKLNYDEFIVWGAETLHIPLILKLNLVNNTHLSLQVQNEISQSVDDIFRSQPVKTTTQQTSPTETTVEEQTISQNEEFEIETDIQLYH